MNQPPRHDGDPPVRQLAAEIGAVLRVALTGWPQTLRLISIMVAAGGMAAVVARAW